MDPYSRRREGAHVGAYQRPIAGRGHSASRDDNPEVARFAVTEGHTTKVL